MAISEAQNRRLTALLEGLEPHVKDMTGASPDFVRSQIERHAQYDDKIFISPRQMQWLEDLYGKHCGGTDDLPDGNEDDPSKDYDEDESPLLDVNDDDDIPF